MSGRLACLFVLLLAAPVLAQVVPERELEIAKSLFDAGNYREAIKRANDAMAATNFTDTQRIELHRISGLSAFNLGETAPAQAAFLQLLQLNPDFVLDPFSAPPPAIRLFEQVRKDNADMLGLVRQQIALRVEQEKRANAQRDKERAEEEERRRRITELSQTVTVRTVERHSLLLNFVPFGIGQFDQGRTGAGLIFAITEGLLGLTSIISFIAFERLFITQEVTLSDRVTSDGKPFTLTVRSIPPENRVAADVWTALKFTTGIGFYAVAIAGIVESLFHHQGDVVTEKRVPLVAPPRVSVFLTPGGAGGGFTWSF